MHTMDEFGENQDRNGFESQRTDEEVGAEQQIDAVLQSTQQDLQNSSAFAEVSDDELLGFAAKQREVQEQLRTGPDVASQMTEEPDVASQMTEEPDVASQMTQEPEVALQSTAALSANAAYTGDISLNVPTEVRQVTKAGLLGAGVGAAGFGGLAAYSAVNAGATAGTAATLGGAAALSGASTVGLGALWLYGGGMLHNLAWGKPGAKKPGAVGTMARGVFWPVTTAAGVVWRHVLRR